MARGKKPELTLLGMRELKCSARTKKLRRRLFHSCRTAIEDNQDDIAGFVLVIWDRTGQAHIAVTPGGPIAPGMVSTYVYSQLQDFRAVDMNDRNVRPTLLP